MRRLLAGLRSSTDCDAEMRLSSGASSESGSILKDSRQMLTCVGYNVTREQGRASILQVQSCSLRSEIESRPSNGGEGGRGQGIDVQ